MIFHHIIETLAQQPIQDKWPVWILVRLGLDGCGFAVALRSGSFQCATLPAGRNGQAGKGKDDDQF